MRRYSRKNPWQSQRISFTTVSSNPEKRGFIKADCLPPEQEWAYRRAEWIFGLLKRKLPSLQEFRSMEHFKRELSAYLVSCSNRRIRTKPKGLNNFY